MKTETLTNLLFLPTCVPSGAWRTDSAPTGGTCKRANGGLAPFAPHAGLRLVTAADTLLSHGTTRALSAAMDASSAMAVHPRSFALGLATTPRFTRHGPPLLIRYVLVTRLCWTWT